MRAGIPSTDVDAPAGVRPQGIARFARLALFTVAPPIVTYAIQASFWRSLSPFAWFLFYPTVFVSSWFGGFASGVGATLLSAFLVWWSFLPPEGSLRIEDPKYIVSTVAYVSMGLAFSLFHQRLRGARKAEVEALGEISRANANLKRTLNDLKIFSAPVENSSDFIGIANPAGVPVYVNPAGRRMVGLAQDTPVERTRIPEYYPPEERAFAADVIMASMTEKGRWQGETFFRHWQSERRIPVSDQHFMIHDPDTGQTIGMGAIVRDVTERKRAEEALQESEAQFSGIVSIAAEAIVSADDALNVVVYNHGAEQVFGWTREEILGRPLKC